MRRTRELGIMYKSERKSGILLTMEAIDGAGKTTQVKLLKEYLEKQECNVVNCREPGGTEVGELVRNILLTKEMDGLTELMLFTASRIQLIKEVILPALNEGKIVVLDRFIDSTYAYQGMGRGYIGEVMRLENIVTDLVEPDHTFLLDLSLEEAEERLKARTGQVSDRFDSMDLKFKQRLYDGFKLRAKSNRDRFVTISATGTPEEVFDRIKSWCDLIIIPQYKLMKANHDS